MTELADKLGVSSAQVQRLESGKRRLTVDMLEHYCHALNISTAQLFHQDIRVPIIGIVDAQDQVSLLDVPDSTPAPLIVNDMENIAAIRWEPAQSIEGMYGHILFFYAHDKGVPPDAWGKRCLIMREENTRCIGWPIQERDATHIDSANGLSEFNVEISWASPILAVVSPYLLAQLNTDE